MCVCVCSLLLFLFVVVVVVVAAVVVIVFVVVVVANHPLSLPLMCAGPILNTFITFTAAVWQRPWAQVHI